MKRFYLLFITPFFFLSCDNTWDCRDIMTGKPADHLVSFEEFSSIKSLFEQNNINSEPYLFYRYSVDERGGTHVKCYQYVKNLRVFSDDLIFHFKPGGYYDGLSGEKISSINLEMKPRSNTVEMRRIFIDRYLQDTQVFERHPVEEGCLEYEIGFYDLNAGTGNDKHNFRLAWRVKHEKYVFPYAYINDSDRSIIYYDNGMRY